MSTPLSVEFNRFEFAAQFAALQDKMLFGKRLSNQIGTMVRNDIQSRIKKGKTDAEGNAWAPWAPSTAKARQKKGNAALGLLFDSGALYKSITVNKTETGFEVVSSSPYLKYLQFGTAHMPARPVMGMSKAVVQQVTELINKKLSEPWAGRK